MMSVRRRDAVLAFFLSVMYNKRKSRGHISLHGLSFTFIR